NVPMRLAIEITAPHLRRAPRGFAFLLLLFLASAAFAQTEVTTTIGANQAAQIIRIVVPFPELAPSAGTATTPIDSGQVRELFFAPLTRHLSYSGVFAIAPPPPAAPITPGLVKRISPHCYLKLNTSIAG